MTHVSLARETACKPVDVRFDSEVRLWKVKMFLASRVSQAAAQNYIIYTVVFVIACCYLLCTWFFESWRNWHKRYIPGGNALMVLGMLVIIGLCVFLLH